MREDAVLALLERAGVDRSVLDQLVEQSKLVELTHEGHHFYMRRLSKTVRG